VFSHIIGTNGGGGSGAFPGKKGGHGGGGGDRSTKYVFDIFLYSECLKLVLI